ncbi:Rpn family recombination-promoting nuclease/putative transposase [Candidatus Symbiopectobacterium endolongispinus]|nr:Rpn family recombination-promoting nuclease/putative transposase [Candidatus Symbiopectobacterium sp. PLON1]MBT9430643.1 Rpn family recombination-promoting nuclease/putative transposase [Candidatus Symbiopectobacterium endolongispinus]
MKKSTTTPTTHDAMFKQFLTHPDTARDFMQLHLPNHLRKYCDLDTLKLESGSFIEDNLRAYYSDVLYSLQTMVGEGYIHVLIEHQSSPDKMMAFRLMRYAIAAMQRHLDAGYKTLPLVIPMVFYAGETSPYPYPLNWLQLFDDPTVVYRLYTENFYLIDVTVIPDDEIMQHRSMAALTLVQKHIRQRDLVELMDRLATIMLTNSMTRQQVRSLINYMVQMGNTANADTYVRQLAQRVPQHGDELMTIAEQLEQKGIEKGIEKGIALWEARGLEKWEREVRLKIARAMLQKGMDHTIIMEMTSLTEDDLAQLHH